MELVPPNRKKSFPRGLQVPLPVSECGRGAPVRLARRIGGEMGPSALQLFDSVIGYQLSLAQTRKLC